MTTATKTLTTKTLTIAGGTYRAKEQLKYEKFTWSADDKTWSREVNVDEAGAIYYGESLQGTPAQYAHHWKCYAKADVTITAE